MRSLAYCLAAAVCMLAAALTLDESALAGSDGGGSGPIAVARRAIEVPIVNLTRALREWNWGGGSCVHASNVMALRWVNQLAAAKWWRSTYSGGESYQGLTDKLRKARIGYYATHQGDVRVLERAISERRGAVIFFYDSHTILLVHLDAQRAIVLDNNRIDQYIAIERDEFIARWKGYGGVAIVPTIGAPRPPLPFL
jgi:hypothetical protein